jgi:hypothetical protein
MRQGLSPTSPGPADKRAGRALECNQGWNSGEANASKCKQMKTNESKIPFICFR